MLSDETVGAEPQPYLSGARTLTRIAVALGTRPESLFQRGGAAELPAHLAAAWEATALLRAFSRITDQRMRQRCLAFLLEAAATDGDRGTR